jgi:HAD superfamily hydrolase (TIGR01509 family)
MARSVRVDDPSQLSGQPKRWRSRDFHHLTQENLMTLALLFDLDGTMVDTDHLHIAAWNAVLAPHGRQIDAVMYKTHVMGFAAAAVTAALFPDRDSTARAEFSDAKETAFRALVHRLEPAAGLLALLSWADSLSVPMAVVTNAPRDNALLLLRGLGLTNQFPVMVIGDELERGKPDPLPYLTALRLLGVDAAQAVAFEDSLSGVRAAVAAGIETIGMTIALTELALRGAGAAAVAQDFNDAALLEGLRRRASGHTRLERRCGPETPPRVV